jgi:hypothetical protein
MEHYFPHEQLEVYGVALRFAALAEELLGSWASSWAVYGQFDRAVESVVVNLARAARLKSTDAGVYSLECSLGSVLELTTSLTLNIAEGNGRFSRVDHSKFIGIAEDARTKLAAYMDMLAPMALVVDVERVKSYLRDVMAMLSGLRGYLDG